MLIKLKLQITFPTFPIKIYPLLTPYVSFVLLFPCACVYCQCQKWPNVLVAYGLKKCLQLLYILFKTLQRMLHVKSRCCYGLWSMCGGDMTVAVLPSTPDWWHGSYNTKHGPVVYSHTVSPPPHHTTTWSGVAAANSPILAMRTDWSQEQCRLVIRSLLVIRYVMDGMATVSGE